MRSEEYTTLVAKLSGIADPRGVRGQRYAWVYLLVVIVVALLAGERSVRGMAQWAQQQRWELLAALQPKWGQIPSAATLHRVLQRIDIARLEAVVAEFVGTIDTDDAVTGSVLSKTGERLRGQAVDGKTVKGASGHGETVHLVSVVRHESGAVLAQDKVAVKLDERGVARTLLAALPLAQTVTTMDALHTQVKLAQQLLDGKGHYLMVVKGNQPTLAAEIALAFQELPPANQPIARFWGYQAYQYREKGHGRLERRTLESITALNDFLVWPAVAQVLRRTCWTKDCTTGKTTQEVHYGLTSLPRALVSLAQVEQFWRWHWTIENRLHYIRDVSMGEDASQVRKGNAPQALAALRNAILSLLRYEGWSLIPDAFRFFAHNVQKSLQLIGTFAS
jgi:predicted transposase YbfD/YdcC